MIDFSPKEFSFETKFSSCGAMVARQTSNLAGVGSSPTKSVIFLTGLLFYTLLLHNDQGE